MRRLLLLFFVSGNLILASAQTQEPKVYTAFDNSKFKQGDSIYLGYYSGYEKFEYVVEYNYNGQYDKGYRRVKGNLVGTKHKILDIYKDNQAIWDTSAYVVEVGEPGFLKGYKLFININQAIKNGEIILRQSHNKEYNRKVLQYNDSIAFLFRVKQSQKPILDFALEYLYRFNNKVFEKYRQDEFELDNQKQIASEVLKTQINKVIDTTTYCINLKLSFDNYDFSSMSFPVGGYDDSYTIIKSADWGKYPSTDMVFVNQKEFSKIQVDKAVANGFIKRKKDKYGNIDRTVFAKVYFKNTVIPSNAPARSAYSESTSRNYLFAIIYRIEYYDFENRKYNFIGQISSNQ